MITLNFTSPKQREINQFHKNYKLVQSLVISSVIVLVIIVVSLYGSQLLLENKLESITEDTLSLKTQTENEKSLNLGETVQSFNKLISNVSSIQAEYAEWSNILIDTGYNVPEGISLTSFTIQKDSSTFQFSGKALTRDSLLSFKNKLESSAFFDNIESPISNLLLKEDISFNLSGTINLDPVLVNTTK